MPVSTLANHTQDDIMIRLADHKDTKIIVALLKKFLLETCYGEKARMASENLEHLCKLVWMTQQYGYIWLAYAKDEPVGLLMAIKEPNMWLPESKELKEIVWYVMPEYRTSTLAGRLFLEFCKKGQALLKQGQIDQMFTTRMTTTDSVDYEKRGFELREMTYIKER